MQALSRVLQQVTTRAESWSELFSDAFSSGFSYEELLFSLVLFFFLLNKMFAHLGLALWAVIR